MHHGLSSPGANGAELCTHDYTTVFNCWIDNSDLPDTCEYVGECHTFHQIGNGHLYPYANCWHPDQNVLNVMNMTYNDVTNTAGDYMYTRVRMF